MPPTPSSLNVVLFPSLALFSQKRWRGQIHGWAYSPNSHPRLTQAAQKFFKKSSGLGSAITPLFRERTAFFLAENAEDLVFECTILGHTFLSQKSKANGHFTAEFEIRSLHPLRSPLQVETHLKGHSLTGLGEGRVFLIPDTEGISVICDIDDTVRNSYVHDTRKLLEYTLDRPFEPVSETVSHLHRFQSQGATFHYVTASPWQMYPMLSEFFGDHQIPEGTFHMKDFRWKDSTFFNLFKSQRDYKLSKIKPLLKSFKKRQFILIGDSSESDLEVYSKLAIEFPHRIPLILIRDGPEKPLQSKILEDVYSKLAQFSPHATLTRSGTFNVIALSKTLTTSFSI